MKKLLVLGLAIFLSSGCVSQPDPWTPDSHVDGKTDFGQNRADGNGDVRSVDMALPDAVEVLIPKTDMVDAAAVDTVDVVEVLDLLDAIDGVDEIECVPQCDVECGDDGCGGSCGECAEAEACYGGKCHQTVVLPDTGQTRCYDSTDETTCPSQGEALFGQDGSFQGVAKSYIGNGDGTVTDQNTGLVWSRCSVGQTGPDCDGVEVKVTQVEAFGQCAGNMAGLPGDGWRLPNRIELLTIFNFAQPPCVGPEFHAVNGHYWTASASCTLWFNICFGSGNCQGGVESAFARCVRGPEYKVGDFVDGGDGTVLDVSTGLSWQKQDDSKLRHWPWALEYCDGLELAGHDDWRIPNAMEAATIADLELPNMSVDESAFPDPGTEGYWTSTTHPVEGYHAVAVATHESGAIGSNNDSKDQGRLVRCVRGGQVQQCASECLGKECGDNGCSDQCGACLGVQDTCLLDQCECQPTCDGKVCGDDGCGEFCGTCDDQSECINGTCICSPDCDGKSCGPDGCGDDCGTCPGSQDDCVDAQCVCQPDCDGENCGDGGCPDLVDVCGKCQWQDICVEGNCECQPNCEGLECGSGGCVDLTDVCGDCLGQDICVDGLCKCQPACDGKECGDDGCGGDCGACEGPQDTCIEGSCVCQPACLNKECGADGCGGECDVCPGDQDECVEGFCVCQPECQGKQCGSDGCGGDCGTCDDENPCNGLEMCNAGSCVAGLGVNCSDVPQCMLTQCNPLTGACDLPADNGTLCDDLSGCTVGDSCLGGECDPGEAVTCPEATECASYECNPGTGNCDQIDGEDGATCDGANGKCAAGICLTIVPDCKVQDCPVLEQYDVICNLRGHCEFSRAQPTEEWHQWDVWIYVPPGAFGMGAIGDDAEVSETPLHQVTVDHGYFVAKYEVVVDQYEACADSEPGRCTPASTSDWPGAQGTNSSAGKAGHPQNGLMWEQAQEFCGWVAPGGRLPSEAEWEYAAAGPSNRLYPWGNQPAPTCSNGTAVFNEEGTEEGYGCELGGTWPAGTLESGAAYTGALDMAGNLWEWCDDWYHPSYTAAPANAESWLVPATEKKVLRGASFFHPAGYIRSTVREGSIPTKMNATLGARCVRPAPATECGDISCPAMDGYFVTCNKQQHCEYYNEDTTGHNKWDVWVYVPPGTFEMGSEGEGGYPGETPLHPVTIPTGYFIGKYEVVVAQYEACNAANPGKCTPADTTDWPGTQGTNTAANGKEDHPQNGLTWQQARDFCVWTAPGGRLPSEAEWEYAATGPVHLKYPWGDAPEPTCSNNTAVFGETNGTGGYGCGQGGTWPAGSKTAGASWCGALDMGGNLWEWNEDWFHDSYADAPDDGSAWVAPAGSSRVIRGGGFLSGPVSLRSAVRENPTPGSRYASYGARCVRAAPAHSCGGIECPKLDGYFVTCNKQQHCEYYNEDTTGHNKWDVWVYVPPGTFPMGSEGEGGGADEMPVHTVTISEGYFIGKYEIVVAQYEACNAANPGTCTPASTADWPGTQGTNTSENGRNEHPQNGLLWQQAKDFCGWVAPGGRLPSEAEWEYAATGPVHLKYPWGNSPDPTCSNNTAVFNEAGGTGGYGCSQGGTWEAGSKTAGASWSGALDMSGNVWEWNEDWHHPSYLGAPADGSAWVDTSNSRVIRGGSFNFEAVDMRSANRGGSTPHHDDAHIGARCVRPAPAKSCGGVDCPAMDGYFVTCNKQDHCEYYNEDTAGHNKWDVWIYVPPGSFEMGSPEEEEGHQTNEWPVHQVNFTDGFMMAKFEVVVAQYQACNAEAPGQCSDPSTSDWSGNSWGTNYWEDGSDPTDPINVYHQRPNHPQNGLTWQQAKDFCGWVAAGGRLPSESEWEYAATGPEHQKYPWGNSPEPSCSGDAAIFSETGEEEGYGCGVGGTWPVGSKNSGMSFCGALDMAGNAWEWCEDYYHGNYGNAPSDGSPWVDIEDTHRVVRGGRFADVGDNLRTARRDSDTPQSRRASNGVRCVRPAECIPDCSMKQCGDNGCGGNCGACGAGLDCLAAKCTISEGLIGWWDFREGEGTTAHDFSGEGHHGEINSPEWVDGLDGNALSLDGANTFVDMGMGPDLHGKSAMTMAVRFKTSDNIAPDQEDYIVAKMNAGYGAGYWMNIDQATLRARIYTDTTDETWTPCLPNTWYHAVVTYDGSKVRLYLSGSEIDQFDLTGPIDEIPSLPGKEPLFQLGCVETYAKLHDRCFKGLIDDVRIYERALEPSEIQVLFNEAQ